MYIPKHFKISDNNIIFNIMKDYSFATLFSQHNGMPIATHLPLILNEEHTYLYGHFSRPNSQWKDIRNQTVLAVFHGPHCYISPTWYETNKAVPTWNYVTVHVYGEIILLDDGHELQKSLNDMVLKYEGTNSTYKIQEIDSEFITAMTKGIQGFKLKINKLEGKAKLSQNHPLHRKELVINRLEQHSHDDEQKIATLMKETLKSNDR